MASAQPAARGPVGGQALKTMFVLDVGQLEHEIQSRKKDLKRGAPAWRPSSDLARTTGLRGAVVLSVFAALAVCGVALATGHGRAIVNHPLSAAHSSETFTAKASGATLCASCHAAGARVDSDRCASCHTGLAPRPKHHTFDCGRCHKEHVGAASNTALGANEQCAGCHAGQHATQFATPGPQRLAAGPLPAKFPVAQLAGHADDPRVVALHVAHTKVKVGGKDVGIGCTSCHAAASSKGELAAFPPGLACYRCHQGGEDRTKLRCDGCHGVEHATSPPGPPSPPPAPSAPTVGSHGPTLDPVRSIGWATGLALLGGTPVLVFGLVVRLRRRGRGRKLVAEMKAHPAEVLKRLVHSINDSKCVGCGLCVQACPASVLELVDHKSRVVNFDSCIQCKRCENACAFDALRMHDADKPPPMIPMPSIDAFYETPVAGMFLVGQVSGTPQVKNATNLGRAVVQRIVQRDFVPGRGRQLGCDVDVIIIGSGPGGLSSALTCVELGLSYVVLEKEREFSWTIRNYYHKGKEVMAEPNDVDLEATLPHWDSTREQLLGAWQELVDQNRLDIRYQHNVIDVKKDGERFVVAIGDGKGKQTGQLTAGRVILAIGTLGNPRRLGCPGDELEKVKNSLVDPDEWIGKSILVVGGSDSAVEVVLALSQPQRRNKVYFSTRGAKLEGIKPKNRKLLEDALAAKQFEIRYATTVAEVTPTTVALAFKEDNRREDLPNDVVFGMIGGNSPQKWLQQIGVPYIEKPHSWSPTRTDQLSQKTAEGLVQIRRLPRRAIPQARPHH
jgi:thioredoxin reductase/ferredoxin